MNPIMTVGQVASRLLCRYTQSTLAASVFAESYRYSYVWIRQKNLWLFVYGMHVIKA